MGTGGVVVAGLKTLACRGVSGVSSLRVDALRASLELASALVVPAEHTALLLELVDADRGQVGGAVVLGGVVVDFVDGDGGVYNLRLDDFLLDDGLDGLVDVAGEGSCQLLV